MAMEREMTSRSRRACRLCQEKKPTPDYKDTPTLKPYLTERGKIIPRRISGNCAGHQRALTTAVKRARQIAFLPFTSDR